MADYPHQGNAIASYFEGINLVGTRTMYCCGFSPSEGVSISAYWPHTAYFCPVCGEIWGREILNYQFQYLPSDFVRANSWAIESRRCVAHGDGLFLTGYKETAQLIACSPELLRREFLVLNQRLPAQAAIQHQQSAFEQQEKRLVSARQRFQTAINAH